MSSTYVPDSSDDHKTDNTLIIIVNNDGSISVDQETLQNLLTTQPNTAVSVVRVGGSSQDDSSQDSSGTCDSQNDTNPHVNLTVEGFYPTQTSAANSETVTATPAAAAVAAGAAASSAATSTTTTQPGSSNEGETLDPFLEMDSEQLERLETALQSEQAKQILGENVTAMLDMLSVEEEATQLKDTILMDHCYTNLSHSSAPAQGMTSASPASATAASSQQLTSGVRDAGDGTLVVDRTDLIQQVTTTNMGPPVPQPIIRGRGRGRPGRPRRDMSSTRGAASSSQRGLGRGVLGRGGMKLQRGGGVVSGTGAGNMIMVQQTKHIPNPLAPPPSSPASAALVPVVRPLVIAASTAAGQVPASTAVTSTVRLAAPGQLQKQIITVPQGARFVVSGAKPGQVDATGQQTVLLASSAGQILQAQQVQGAVPSPTAIGNNAKVLVAKMPVFVPPQLLGAQSSTLPLNESSSQQLQKEDESDFTDFPQEPSEDSDSGDSDIGSDEEYRGPTVVRRGGRGAKGRGRVGRVGRGRAMHRVYEGGRGGRGGRRGRGRGYARLDDVDKAKKLEAEMAAVVAAMEKSPERASHVEKAVHQEKISPKREEIVGASGDAGNSDTSKKKILKVYGKSNKKSAEQTSDDGLAKADSGVSKEKVDKLSVQTPAEKKSPILKSPTKKQASESTPTPPAPPNMDSRKNYPKRENRKPPAHLAEALGPALFSTPDIIRRVSTGSEQKAEASQEEKKDILKTPPSNGSAEATAGVKTPPAPVLVPATAPAPLTPPIASAAAAPTDAENAEKCDGSTAQGPSTQISPEGQDVLPEEMQVDTDSGLTDTMQTEAAKPEELLAESSSLQNNITEDSAIPEIVKPVESVVEEKVNDSTKQALSESPALAAAEETGKSQDSRQPPEGNKPQLQMPQTQTPQATKSAAATVKVQAATRSSRRRSSNSSHKQNHGDAKSKKETGKQNSSASTKEKKRADDKQKGRRKLPEVDDDDDCQSSDDESWNSEDDPDRLWCICKKPHNNRFMICCDVCEDWFHGKCVGVTKAMGQQMENKGLEWSCPNCSKKREEQKDSKKHNPQIQKEKDVKKLKESRKEGNPGRAVESSYQDVKETGNPGEGTSHQSSSSDAQVMYCIVCKKAARPSSIYCGDACILTHAQEALNVLNKEKAVAAGLAAGVGSRDSAQQLQQQPQQGSKGSDAGRSQLAGAGAGQPSRTRPDARVIVFERKTGRLLAGPNAPTAGNLKSWLKDNPTFEVVRPGLLPTTKYYSTKLQSSKNPVNIKTNQQKGGAFQSKVNQSPTGDASTSHSKLSPTTQKPGTSPKGVIQQKLQTSPTKLTPNQLKAATPAITQSKSVPTKIQKTNVVITQAQKVQLKSPVHKSPTIPSKSLLKSPTPSTSSMTKVPSSPSKTPPGMVSKAAATSTVKETAKAQAEKPAAKKVEVKRQSSASSESGKKEEEKDKPQGPEPIRLNIRKTLQELLQARIQECSDLQVSETEVQSIAVNIEEELHSFFRDTGIKYKSKYRSLVFNIKDPKNLTLFRKIAEKSLTPHQLVRLSPEELASQELAQWREREAKHQLEMIKKNELDMMSQAKTYVMKTHKGEQVIETDETLKVEVPELVDPSSVPDLVSPVNNSVSSTVEDIELDKTKSKSKDKDRDHREKSKEEKDRVRDRDKSKHDDKKRDKGEKSRKDEKDRRDSHHDKHDREKRRESKEREKSKSSSKDKHRNSDRSKRDSDRHKESKGGNSRKEKKEDADKREDVKKEEVPEIKEEVVENDVIQEVKSESDVLCKVKTESVFGVKVEPQEDSDMSDREPSSTVTIKTPDINTEDQEKNITAETVWKGFVNMPDVAKFFTTVQVVSGDPQNLCKDLPDTVDIVGRIVPETVWEYISKMKKTGTKEILVIRLTAANEEEKIPYITLYTYLNTRNRLGVVGNVSKMIKDFYIMPLASHNPVPQVLLPLDGPGFEDYRPHLLLGILVRARRKRLAPENEYVAKVPKRLPPTTADPTERSYTPPLPGGNDPSGSLTPPHPPPTLGSNYTPPSSPHLFLPGPSLLSKNTDPRLTKDAILEDLNLDDESGSVGLKAEKSALASHVGQYGADDDDDDDDGDAPYSPGGGSDDDDVEESSEDNLLMTAKNPSDLQRKVEELNRKIEEQKQQIQTISSAIVGSDPSAGALGAVTETLKVNTMMQSYMLGSCSEETPALATAAASGNSASAPSSANEDGDENEAYSPSRSFTPPSATTPTNTSIPFIGPPEKGTTTLFSTLPSNINLPSNLHEILATIKKQESDKAAGTKGINLKLDPIVQNYGKAADMETVQPKTPREDFTGLANSPGSSSGSATALQSASSALLSLSTPVIHPLASGGSVVSTSVSTKTTEPKVHRDPRQRGTAATAAAAAAATATATATATPTMTAITAAAADGNNKSGSTLSTLSDDDLIKKALEMEMEMTDPKIKTGVAVEKSAAVNIPALQQPLPPGVDSLPAVSSSTAPHKSSMIAKSIPPGQPLPPGVEDEEYPSYSSTFGTPPQNTAISPMAIPMPPMALSVNYPVRAPNSPAPYRMSQHYSGSGYNMGPPPRVPPQGPGYSSSFVPSSPRAFSPPKGVSEDSSSASTSKLKRKFAEGEADDSANKRDRCDSPSSVSRDSWEKMPVPVRGRFGVRGRGFIRGGPSGQRGFIRPRGGMTRNPMQNRSRWDNKANDRKRMPRYDSGRSDWDSHSKDYEDKHRDRTKDARHRERSRERDRPSSSQRPHGTRSGRSRDGEKGSESP